MLPLEGYSKNDLVDEYMQLQLSAHRTRLTLTQEQLLLKKKLQKPVQVVAAPSRHRPVQKLKAGSFTWLMVNLCQPSPKVEACPVLFPDTVFFENGVAQAILQTNPATGLLQSITQESKLERDKII